MKIATYKEEKKGNMMKVYKGIFMIIITIVFFNISISNAYGNRNINFENITIDDGLSQSTVEALIQDSNGYIWIGTNDGLNRYNGSEMKIFKPDEKNENSLISNYVIALAEDKNKKLWVGTDKGLSVINLKNYSIKNYAYSDKDKGTPFYNINTICIRKNGDVMIGTPTGVYIFNEEEDSFTKILGDKNELTNNNVQDIKEDKYNNLWIGTLDGLNKVNMENKKVIKYESNKEKNIVYNNIYTLMCDDNGNIWLSTLENGIYKVNVKTNKVTSYKHDENNKNSLPSNGTRNVFQDKDGSIWVATDKGLSKLIGDNEFITYNNKSYDINSLANNLVITITQDDSGLIWVGTYTGISVFDPSNNIEIYKNDPLDENTLSENVIHGIYEDEDNLLWVGTKDKGVNIINRKNNEINHLYEGNDKNNLSSNSIRAITGKDNIIWIATNKGLNKINKDNMIVEKYTELDGLSSNNIKSLLVDSKGYIWIGTYNGLDILNPRTKEIISMTKLLKKPGIGDLYIEEIYEDKDGIYWIGNLLSSELMKINPKDKSLKRISICDNDDDVHCGVSSIVEDEYNHLWIGTNKGLIKFNKNTEKLKVYTEEDGLANDNVYGIIFDNEGNPWMSTNNGISKFDLEANKFRTLTSTDGLQSNEFNGKASLKCKNGELVFGGIKGMNIFNPKDVMNNFSPPKVVLDNFQSQVNSYDMIDDITLKYNENLIRINYFIPEYKNNNNVQYYYRLKGLDKNWIKTKNNEVIFNKLDSGKYTFEIKARSQDGTIGDISRIKFKIKPPIWMSNEAIIMYVFILLLFIINSINKVKRLDTLVAKRTEELSKEIEKNKILFEQVLESERSKNNYFINLSHELRTPLNVINSVEQLITNFNKSEKGMSRDKIDYYMDVMRNNTRRLLNLINNIIDTSKVENGKYRINKEENDIVYIVEEAALSLKESIKSSGIDLIIDTNVEEKIIKCDSQEIERCIVNLVSNATKFTPPGGTITVDIEDCDNWITIRVEDTGIGIDEKYHEAVFDRFNQVVDAYGEMKGGSGLGLTITKHIINLHNGKIYLKSKKNEGSIFTIYLPAE